ncbi:alanine racemase [Cloacibacillus evryensis]|uniref:alanine racemase n=1 Tax=Cloacibacillus evryensis TaxID=508460 RepID=UPI0004BA2594|nr:alanine racemase [Cloacibacillus evryensis]MEA5036400.1 alanine racemase [Cloacibacillus evryensis]
MNEKYPILEINKNIIRRNAETILVLCRKNGVEPFAVIKGFNALDGVTEAIVEAGYKTLASSRLPHLAAVRRSAYDVETLALRIPMLSEIPEVIEYCDISLNSELETLKALDKEARSADKIHKVILMRDLGDLREGIFERERFIETAISAEKHLPNLRLFGVGTNLTCYGSVIPTVENLSVLAKDAAEIERAIGRELEVVSGGNTTSIPLMVSGKMPKKVNNLRIGEAITVPCDLAGHWHCPVEGLSNEGLILRAEVIEVGSKPTHPIGELGVNCFGSYSDYEDRGVRRRALVALGAFDIGACDKLIPQDKGVKILGASSDHMIIDIEDSSVNYGLGDVMSFTLHYQAMLFATANPFITKKYVN